MSTLTKILKGSYDVYIKDATTQSLIVIAERFVAEAKSLSPVDLGQLRNAIMYTLSKMQGGFNDNSGESASFEIRKPSKDNEAYVGFNLLYGIYQEFGTKTMKPQPFMRLAYEIIVNNKSTLDAIAEINRQQMKLNLSNYTRKESYNV